MPRHWSFPPPKVKVSPTKSQRRNITMQSPRSPLGRLLVLGLAATALVFGYSAASTAIELTPPAEEAAAAAEPTAPAEGETEEIDEARLLAGLQIYKDGSCRGCHGWAADGVREGPNPQGPSLRETFLPMEAIRLTVACGRPGTEMPYFWRDAYRRDSTDCYGVTGGDLGDQIPLRGGARFNDEQIDDLVYYLEYFVKGLGEITKSECEFYYGEGNSRCETYPDDPA